ncbi:hypothetical protein KUTeg_017209 [Tegillarca granosa]|uniref:Uncharacterized protein n=1 Tax=Tegillarca granosa TaxID=220873 RepID=A0ABQ9EIY0_TEGGR|nr:hypothetical protein KUTeg_017209 [Tegillarca granosa]
MVKCQGKKGDEICGFELSEEFQCCPICTTPVQKDKEPPDDITINCPGKKKNGDVCQVPVKKGQKFCKKCGWRVNSKIFKAGSRVCYAKLENDKDCLNVLSSDDEFCEECGNEWTNTDTQFNTAKTEGNSGEENKDQGYTASAANKGNTVQETAEDKKATEQIEKQTTEQTSIQSQQNVKNQSQSKNEYTEMTDSKNNNESAETAENHNKDGNLETTKVYCIDGSSKESEDNISGQNKDTIKVEQKKSGITESTSGSDTKQTLNFDNQQNARQPSDNEDKNENVLQPVEPSGNAQSQTTAYVQLDIMCDTSIDKTSNQQNTNNVELQHQSDRDLDQNSSEITLQESEQGQSKEKDKSIPSSPSQRPGGVLSQQDNGSQHILTEIHPGQNTFSPNPYIFTEFKNEESSDKWIPPEKKFKSSNQTPQKNPGSQSNTMQDVDENKNDQRDGAESIPLESPSIERGAGAETNNLKPNMCVAEAANQMGAGIFTTFLKPNQENKSLETKESASVNRENDTEDKNEVENNNSLDTTEEDNQDENEKMSSDESESVNGENAKSNKKQKRRKAKEKRKEKRDRKRTKLLPEKDKSQHASGTMDSEISDIKINKDSLNKKEAEGGNKSDSTSKTPNEGNVDGKEKAAATVQNTYADALIKGTNQTATMQLRKRDNWIDLHFHVLLSPSILEDPDKDEVYIKFSNQELGGWDSLKHKMEKIKLITEVLTAHECPTDL